MQMMSFFLLSFSLRKVKMDKNNCPKKNLKVKPTEKKLIFHFKA